MDARTQEGIHNTTNIVNTVDFLKVPITSVTPSASPTPTMTTARMLHQGTAVTDLWGFSLLSHITKHTLCSLNWSTTIHRDILVYLWNILTPQKCNIIHIVIVWKAIENINWMCWFPWRICLFLTYTRVLFWYSFPSLLRNLENEHQNNPLESAETVRHSSTYRKTSSISCTKSQNLNVSCILFQLSSFNPLKPGVFSW